MRPLLAALVLATAAAASVLARVTPAQVTMSNVICRGASGVNCTVNVIALVYLAGPSAIKESIEVLPGKLLSHSGYRLETPITFDVQHLGVDAGIEVEFRKTVFNAYEHFEAAPGCSTGLKRGACLNDQSTSAYPASGAPHGEFDTLCCLGMPESPLGHQRCLRYDYTKPYDVYALKSYRVVHRVSVNATFDGRREVFDSFECDSGATIAFRPNFVVLGLYFQDTHIHAPIYERMRGGWIVVERSNSSATEGGYAATTFVVPAFRVFGATTELGMNPFYWYGDVECWQERNYITGRHNARQDDQYVLLREDSIINMYERVQPYPGGEKRVHISPVIDTVGSAAASTLQKLTYHADHRWPETLEVRIEFADVPVVAIDAFSP